MDHIRVASVSEPDFDEIITAAGGKRTVEDPGKVTDPNADYVLDGSVLELKLLEEEGLDGAKKAQRRKRMGPNREQHLRGCHEGDDAQALQAANARHADRAGSAQAGCQWPDGWSAWCCS